MRPFFLPAEILPAPARRVAIPFRSLLPARRALRFRPAADASARARLHRQPRAAGVPHRGGARGGQQRRPEPAARLPGGHAAVSVLPLARRRGARLPASLPASLPAFWPAFRPAFIPCPSFTQLCADPLRIPPILDTIPPEAPLQVSAGPGTWDLPEDPRWDLLGPPGRS